MRKKFKENLAKWLYGNKTPPIMFDFVVGHIEYEIDVAVAKAVSKALRRERRRRLRRTLRTYELN